MSGNGRRYALPLWVVGIALGGLSLVMMSPLALNTLTYLPGIDWNELGKVSQVLGAGASFLAALAFAGVATSLLFQAHNNKITQQQTRHTFHHNLINLALGDPLYVNAIGGSWHQSLSTDAVRQQLYVHLWVSFWHMLFDIGDLPEEHLRHILKTELFTGEAGRDYWSTLGKPWWSERDRTGRSKKYCDIIEDEYRKALAVGPPLVPADPDVEERQKVRAAIMRGIALAIAILGGSFLACRTRQR